MRARAAAGPRDPRRVDEPAALEGILFVLHTGCRVLFAPLLETNLGVRAHRHRPGRPPRRPDKLRADKGYDCPRRRYLHHRGIKVRIARRNDDRKAPDALSVIVPRNLLAPRYLLAAVLLAVATACSSTPPPSTAAPAPAVTEPEPEPTVVYTAETDPNKLLGRPNGYTSKASFTDSRIKTSEVKDERTGSVDQGGSVEVYADEAGATARKKFIDDTMKATPILGTEYSYVDGPVLLRVSQALTPDQAAEYETALRAN